MESHDAEYRERGEIVPRSAPTSLVGWGNFRTGGTDWLPSHACHQFTEEQARQYIPQGETVQNLFGCYLATGRTVMDALGRTLEAVCGISAAAEAVAE